MASKEEKRELDNKPQLKGRLTPSVIAGTKVGKEGVVDEVRGRPLRRTVKPADFALGG
jgi:hypothetical protein